MSHHKKFDDSLLEEKKVRFIEATVRASALLQLPTPAINFFDCSEFDGDHLAHYHSDENKVCVSKDSLIGMDYDAVFDTATHEVTHMLVEGHDSEFDRIHGEVNTAIWEPPKGLGLTHIDPYNTRKVKLKAKKAREGECGYHLCNKDAKLQCSFCEKEFCHKHSKAKQPGMVKIGSEDLKERIRADSMKSSEGHPCVEYEEDPSAYEPRGFHVYDAPSNHLSDLQDYVKYEESVLKPPEVVKKKKASKKKDVVNKNGFVRGGTPYSQMFDGRPLQKKKKGIKEETISEDVIGFWEWLKSLLKR